VAIRFTFRQLEYFVAVGEAGSIAAASERINISPPSISAAVSQLEAEFGVELFVRQHAQGLSLTPGGRRFFNTAKALLISAGGLHDVANQISEQVRGPITVGCLVTLAPFVLPDLRKRFEEAYPDAVVRQVEAHQADLFRMLRRAEIDVATTYDLELPSDIEFEPLAALPPYALFPADHPLAGNDVVSLETLAEHPLVLLDLPLSREYFLSLFQGKNLRPKIAERTAHLPMVRTMVANGFGYGLLNIPSSNEKALDGKLLRYVPLADELRPMNLGLITMRSEKKSRILTAFEDHCRDRITTGTLPGMAAS
jgi:DNA-binding transcriptional LysR family regulator